MHIHVFKLKFFKIQRHRELRSQPFKSASVYSKRQESVTCLTDRKSTLILHPKYEHCYLVAQTLLRVVLYVVKYRLLPYHQQSLSLIKGIN